MRLRTILVVLTTVFTFIPLPEGGATAEETVMVRFITTEGNIDLELYPDEAPLTVANFVEYVNAGFYDGLVFHRVIPGFVIQGGGLEPGLQRRATRAPPPNEADNGLKNLQGTLSMARTGEPHSATSQFFINLADNVPLDHTGKDPRGWGYAVFGKIVAGQEVVEAIAAVPTGTVGQHQDVPTRDIQITKAEVLAP